MSRLVKELLTEHMTKSLAGAGDMVILDLSALDGNENNSMRLGLRAKDIRVHVLNNRLAKRVFQEIGLSNAIEFLEGPTAVAWGAPSIVELAKEITEWSRKLGKIEIKGGAAGGQALSATEIHVLSTLPSIQQLIARVVHLAQNPGRSVQSLITAPAARIRAQLQTKAEQSSGEADSGSA